MLLGCVKGATGQVMPDARHGSDTLLRGCWEAVGRKKAMDQERKVKIERCDNSVKEKRMRML